MRIVSLLPSATEIVCALGAQGDLVGVSHECDHPEGVDELPVLTRPRSELPGSAGGIDRTVRELVGDALGVYEVDLDRLQEVHPDVLVTQDLCDVCAVSMDTVRRALSELALGEVSVVSCRPLRLADVWEDIRRVGRAIGRAGRGRTLAADLERRVSEVNSGAQQPGSKSPSVLTLEWLDPVMAGGLWMPDLIVLAGGRPLAVEGGERAPLLAWSDLVSLDPDVVLVKPCGYSLRQVRTELELLRTKLPWSRWRAAQEGRVYIADGHAYFNRPGPRLVESLEILAACLHPHAFQDLARRHRASARRITTDLQAVPFTGG